MMMVTMCERLGFLSNADFNSLVRETLYTLEQYP